MAIPQSEATRPQTVYAVGDIHGCRGQLEALYKAIENDIRANRISDWLVVFLGDYVDRGPDSAGVVDFLFELSRREEEHIFLKGNHEEMMLGFLEAPSRGLHWLENGGLATLMSYGVELEPADLDRADFEAIAQRLDRCLPSRHLSFLQELRLTHQVGDYLFVHAGIRPDVSLAEQSEHDLLWIREPFLGAERGDGMTVVHGHSPDYRPQVMPQRIGVDTMAFATGTLTAVVLDGGVPRFLSTG